MRLRQSPRTPAVTTPRDEDEPGDVDGTAEDSAFADENESLNPATEPPTTGTKRRGRSPNWLACEIVGALLARQYASRDGGASSRREVRQSSAARVYPSIIRALDRAGLCTWSLESGKLPQSADESVKVRTEATAQATIYAKGDALKQGLESYCQEFGTLYPGFSKNSYAPSSGDNDGTVTWNATEVATARHFRSSAAQLLGGVEACQFAFRIVCPSSPYLPEESDLRSYVDTAFALNPAERLDQETIPTQAELRRYKKRQLKVAANDMVYGQIPNVRATEHAASERQELMGFMRELREMMRAEAARDENEMNGQMRDADDYERDLRDKLRAEMQEQIRAEMQEQMRAEMQEQMRAEMQEQIRAEMQEQIRASVQEQILAMKQSLEAVPPLQSPFLSDVQTPQRAVSPAPSPPAVAVEPSRRSVRVRRATHRG